MERADYSGGATAGNLSAGSMEAPLEGGGLSAKQLVQFVLDGYLEFDDIVPEELNTAVHEDQLHAPQDARWSPTQNLNAFWDASEAVRAVHALPRYRAILESLMRPNPIANHSYLHITTPRKREAQNWHVDQDRSSVQIIRPDPFRFDLLTFYYSHDVPREMGPTVILPGSHLRFVSGRDLTRYKNVLGQKYLAGSGGRMVFIHGHVWHAAQPNLTDEWRFMFKVRYNPRVPQRAIPPVEGWDSPEIRAILRSNVGRHKWFGSEADTVAGTVERWWNYYAGGELDGFEPGSFSVPG